ncbi:iron-containing alcohol dehydrogenase family protein [Natronorubrum sp. FCH18a]|uniref:iron-containing alcohol dehydrogenase family protein n=1 Tax=Natronorubrum sp. FCH18a TaxID=3447018 RepID=UPI003F5140FA
MLTPFKQTPVPYKITFGKQKISQISNCVDDEHENIFIICGESVLETGLPDQIASHLSDFSTLIWPGVRSHVPVESIKEGKTLLCENDIDVVVSVGGGSAIDTGKAICIADESDYPVEELIHADCIDAQPEINHITVPTTLSAAEMTNLAGVSWPDRDMKKGIKGRGVFVDDIIYDPLLLEETPSDLIASTGMNALNHGIEMVYCNKHQPFTDATALHSIRLLYTHLPDAVKGNQESLAYVQVGASISLLGYTNSATAINHSVAHILGVRYGIPHGIANAVVLPYGMRFNLPVATNRFAIIGEALGVSPEEMTNKEVALEGIAKCENLVERLDLPTRLGELGVPKEDLALIAERLLEEDFINSNPQKLTKTNIRKMLENMY